MIALSRLSLALPLLFGGVRGLDLDVGSKDSIKAAAKTLAGGIMAAYDQFQGPGGTPGLWEGGDASVPYYWWQYGLTWNSLIEYSHLTGDHQYDELISQALVHQIGDLDAFMPPNQTKTLGNEDQASWGLAALTAAEVGFKDPKDLKWIDVAKNVFDTQAQRWDDQTCGGGLKWQIFTFNNGYTYKNSMSNGVFFLLSARLAKLTGNGTYAEWAEKSFKWSQDVGLVSDDFQVYDGTDDRQNCSDINQFQWSSTHGLYLDGSAVMYSLNQDDKWKTAAEGFVKAGDSFVENDVLNEVACEDNQKCNTDQKLYKGMAARSYARAAVAAPPVTDQLRKILEASAKAAAETCDGEGLELTCGVRWTAENEETFNVGEDGLSEVYSVFEAVQGLLYADTDLVSANATPSGSPSGTPSGNQTGNPTPTASPIDDNSAAGKMTIAWAGIVLSGALAVFGL